MPPKGKWRYSDMNKETHIGLNQTKWDSRARTFDWKCFDIFRYMQRRLVKLLDLKPGIRLLDLGCGTGRALGYANKLVKGQGEFYGIDISAGMIEKANANFPGRENIHFYQTSADSLPFENGFFDFVISSNSFHHYFDPVKALVEVRRVLKPGGKAYILDLTSDGFFARMIDQRSRAKEKEHVKYYSSPEFRALFSEAGLKYLDVKSIIGGIAGMPVKAHIAEKD
jgi:ubiquinone/menaquinone biosynthesis C-methylase UbiE